MYDAQNGKRVAHDRVEIYMEVVPVQSDEEANEAATGKSGESRKETKPQPSNRGVEPLRAAAYRFWIFFPDSSFDINLAMERLMEQNRERIHKLEGLKNKRVERILQEHEVAETIHSRNAWVTRYVGSYNTQAGSKALNEALPLTDPENTAKFELAFSREEAFNHAREMGKANAALAVRKRQIRRKYYISEKGYPIFPDPSCVYRIPAAQFTPALLRVCRMPHRPDPHRDMFINLREKDQRTYAQERQQHAVAALMMAKDVGQQLYVDCFTLLRDKNEKKIKKMLSDMAKLEIETAEREGRSPRALEPEERAAAIRNFIMTDRVMWDDLASACSKESETNLRVKAIINWAESLKEMCREEGRIFSLMRFEAALDPSLSPFANMKAMRFMALERVYKTISLHSLVDLIYVAAMSCLNPAYGMNVNVILSGAAEVGKSYIGELMDNCILIKDTVTQMGHTTKHAHHTTSDMDTSIYYHDEFEPTTLGIGHNGKSIGGTGDATFKQLLTSGTQATMAYFQLEDGRRITQYIKTRQRSVTIGNFNDSSTEIPDPIASRALVYNVPNVLRKGRSVAQLHLDQKMFESIALGCDDDPRVRVENHTLQTIHYLTWLVNKMIEVKMIPEPTMTVADIVFQKMTSYLELKGYKKPLKRDMLRLRQQARTLTIHSAIYTAFFTPVVFGKEIKEFELTDMMKLAPLLLCTEEIAVYTVTSMLMMFVNNMEAIIMRLLVKTECMYDSAQTIDNNTPFRRGNGGEPDYNYFRVKIERNGFNKDAGINDLAKRVKNMIVAEDKYSISAQNIKDVFIELMKRKMPCKALSRSIADPSKTLETESAHMQLRDIIEFDGAAGYAYILKQYIDSSYTPGFDDIGINAVNEIQHAHTRPRYIITGLTYDRINGKSQEYSAPFILKTVELKPIKEKVLFFLPLMVPMEKLAQQEAELGERQFDKLMDILKQPPAHPRLTRLRPKSKKSKTLEPADAEVETDSSESAPSKEGRKNLIPDDVAKLSEDSAIQYDKLAFELNVDLEHVEWIRHVKDCGFWFCDRAEYAYSYPENYCTAYFDYHGMTDAGKYPKGYLNDYLQREKGVLADSIEMLIKQNFKMHNLLNTVSEPDEDGNHKFQQDAKELERVQMFKNFMAAKQDGTVDKMLGIEDMQPGDEATLKNSKIKVHSSEQLVAQHVTALISAPTPAGEDPFTTAVDNEIARRARAEKSFTRTVRFDPEELAEIAGMASPRESQSPAEEEFVEDVEYDYQTGEPIPVVKPVSASADEGATTTKKRVRGAKRSWLENINNAAKAASKAKPVAEGIRTFTVQDDEDDYAID